MSKLERLIEELCPDGVEYKKLEQIITFQNGKGHEKDVNDAGEFIIVNAKFISTDGKVKKYCSRQICPVFKEDILMVMSDLPNGKALAKCFIVGINDKYSLNQRIGRLTVKEKEIINYKFLYYILNRNKQLLRHDNKVDQTNLKKSDILNILIPVPPLPIQEEIVRILDSFTELTAELKAELTARKKQYEWYRDMLLKKNKVQIVKLGEICDLKAGATPKTSVKDYWEKGTIPWMSSGEVNLKKVYKTEKTITQKGYNNCSTKLIPENSVIVALAGQGKTRGTVAMNMIPLCTNQSLCALICRDVINPYYLYYYLQTQYDNLRYISSGNGNRGGLNLKMLESYMIPLPPLEEQQRIVDILDRFDKLCNDISEGLPAEIDARQKQYEYYRDKLLTFKRLEDREGIEDERV